MNSNSVCIDSSLALAWLLVAQQNDNADAIRQEWSEKSVELLGPPMFHAEVTSVLRQQVFFKRILPEEGEELFSVYLEIPIRIIDGQQIYRKAWELAKKFNLPVCYDMQYLAVAELADCELWTADKKLASSLKGKAKRIRWVGEAEKKS
ncbi:MAG: putative nucleic acid-binding protein, contains domain [Dehalococcoidales bacterium]|nr:putative nucleic acid-binding protein, contains domain [Dehalococcoidales bacterium]